MQSLLDMFKSRPPITKTPRYLPNDLSRLYGNDKLSESMVEKHPFFAEGVVRIRNNLPRVRLPVMVSEKLFDLVLEELEIRDTPWMFRPNGKTFRLNMYDGINAANVSQAKTFITIFLDSPEYKVFPIVISFKGHASAAVIRKASHPLFEGKGYLEVYEPGFAAFLPNASEDNPVLDYEMVAQGHAIHRVLGLGDDIQVAPTYSVCPLSEGPQTRVKGANVDRYGAGLCRTFAMMALVLRVMNPDRPLNEVAAYITQGNNEHVMELAEKFAYAFARIWAKYKQTDRYKQDYDNPFLRRLKNKTVLLTGENVKRYRDLVQGPGNNMPRDIMLLPKPKSLKYGYGFGHRLYKPPLYDSNYWFSKSLANGEFVIPESQMRSNPYVSNNAVMKGVLARLRNDPKFDRSKDDDMGKFMTDMDSARARLSNQRQQR